jgi:hypothetical protein
LGSHTYRAEAFDYLTIPSTIEIPTGHALIVEDTHELVLLLLRALLYLPNANPAPSRGGTTSPFRTFSCYFSSTLSHLPPGNHPSLSLFVCCAVFPTSETPKEVRDGNDGLGEGLATHDTLRLEHKRKERSDFMDGISLAVYNQISGCGSRTVADHRERSKRQRASRLRREEGKEWSKGSERGYSSRRRAASAH